MKLTSQLKYMILVSSLLVIVQAGLFGELKAQSSENNTEVEKAFQLLEEVKQANKYISTLDSLCTIDLPVGIGAKGQKDAEKYAIIISEITLQEGQTYLDAYVAFTVPGTTKKIAFKGVDIPFSFSGGIFDEAQLLLVSDFDIQLSKSITLTLNGSGETSVTMDCNGFKEMEIAGEVVFDKDLFVSENADGSLKDDVLTSSFKTTLTDWNDVLLGISIDPFQLKTLPGVGFSINNAVLDLSDYINPNGIAFGSSHQSDYFIEGNQNIWQGVYIQDAQVRLPAEFRSKTEAELENDSVLASSDTSYISSDSIYAGRMTFYTQNILIDELGFTGKLGVSNLMRLDEGDLGGWNYSIESFLIDIEANQLVSGQFSGQILVPKFEINQVFNYSAQIGLNGTYSITAAITEVMSLPILGAELNLAPNSQITVGLVDHEFRPALYLNGELLINASSDKEDTTSPKLALAKLAFEGMQIQTVKPYFDVEKISYGSDQNLFSNFPVSINKLGLITSDNKLGLELGLNVNFTKPESGGFAGQGDFTIWAKEENDKWSYDGVQIDKIAVDISKGDAFTFFGQVNFIRGDETFGNGFRGELAATMGGFGLQATALFGNVSNYRYWFADALFTTDEGIPAGPVSLYSFSGGAYYHVAPGLNSSGSVAEIGMSQSGIIYIPDETKGLNLKAGTDFGLTGAPTTFNGGVEFGMNFTTSGGLEKIYFEGNAYFMTKDFGVSESKLLDRAKFIYENSNGSQNMPADDDKSELYGNIYMEYVVPTKTFHSNFDIYANIGGGVVKGVGVNGKAGWGVMHFAPDDWYVHLGTPENPNGIEVMGLARMTNYFMAGKSVPDLPLPPSNVMEILGTTEVDYRGLFDGQENLSTGSGVLLGGGFEFDTGDRTFLMFYGRFGCGIGLDILLKKYDGMSCENSTGSIGINGWYAQGQAWSWVDANIGINVDLPFYSGKYSILDISTAALLEAKAPNPFWMKGDIDGDYDLLGGLVKGNFSFEFEIGEQCQMIAASPFSGKAIIADISPAENETDVSVFTTPQVVFNMPVDEIIEITDNNNITKYFRIRLNAINITSESGQAISGSLTWNEDHDVLAFKPFEVLPGEEKIQVYAEVAFEERRSGNWYSLSNGEKSSENKTCTFITGEQPPYIPQENVTYSYPAYRTYNYYQLESNSNYIQLASGQDYLFDESAEWIQKAKVTEIKTGNEQYFDYYYNTASREVKLMIPQSLNNNSIYRLELVNVPASSASNIDENVEEDIETVDIEDGNSGTSMVVTTQHAEGERSELQEKSIYSMEFRTSISNTLENKISSIRKSDGVSWELYPLVHSLTVNIYGERFDSYEVENLQTGMAISIEPILEETRWYQDYILPIIGLSDSELSYISAAPFSCDSLSSYFFETSGTRRLSDDEIELGTTLDYEVLSGMKYYLSKQVAEYHAYLKGQAANASITSTSSVKLKNLLNSYFIPLRSGAYPVRIYYTLPGKNEPVNSFKYLINYVD